MQLSIFRWRVSPAFVNNNYPSPPPTISNSLPVTSLTAAVHSSAIRAMDHPNKISYTHFILYYGDVSVNIEKNTSLEGNAVQL